MGGGYLAGGLGWLQRQQGVVSAVSGMASQWGQIWLVQQAGSPPGSFVLAGSTTGTCVVSHLVSACGESGGCKAPAARSGGQGWR